MPIMTPFEADLARLDWLRNEMQTLYEEIPRMQGQSFLNNSVLTVIIGGAVIIRLATFIDVRERLLVEFRERGRDGLDECLKPFWFPIVLYEETIREMRDSYFAHMQENTRPFEKHPEEVGALGGFPTSRPDIRFYAGCVWKYSIYVNGQFKYDYKSAETKFRLTRSLGKPRQRLPADSVDLELEKSETTTRTNLIKAGFIKGSGAV